MLPGDRKAYAHLEGQEEYHFSDFLLVPVAEQRQATAARPQSRHSALHTIAQMKILFFPFQFF